MALISSRDVQQNLAAVWAVFRGRPDAIRQVDASYEGFWRSFLVIVLLIPVYVPFVMSEIAAIRGQGLLPEDFSPVWHGFVRALSIAVDWVLFPVVMLLLARPMGITSRYAPYIAAHNWSNLILAIPLVLPGILLGLGLISSGLAGILLIAGLAIFVRMRFVVARAALDVSVATAAGLVLLDFLGGLAVAQIFDRLAGF
ncbi:MAG: hypothetical protein AB7O39_09290 [Flavobacteriaceae bacterium]